MRADLPPSWATAPLTSLCKKLRGVSYKGDEASPVRKRGYLPILRANNIDGDRLTFSELVWVPSSRVSDHQRLIKGDVVVAMSSGSKSVVGKTAQVMSNWEGSFGAFCGVLRPYPQIDSRYFGLFLRTREYRNQISELAKGSNINNLKNEHFAAIEVPLAPPDEQRRIVLKLEKPLAMAEECQNRIERASVILRRFRQSVLAAACSGRLTADWRESNLSGFQMDATLSEIERRQFLLAKTNAQKEKCHQEFSAQEEGDSEELPDNWRFVRLNKLVRSFDYGTSAKSQRSGRIPVLRMGNLQGGIIDWSDLAYTSDAEEIRHYSLTPQTVLFNRTNSPELVGKTAIYRGEMPAIFAGYLIRINPHAELNAEYVNLCLNTPYAREFCASVKTDGVSQSNINAQKLGTFEIPFCDPAEQQEIVRRVKGLFSFADRIEARLKVARQQVDRLPQSILAKAFRGELITTEAELAEREGRSYETAEQLLERIRAANPDTSAIGRNAKTKRRRHVR